MRRRFPILPIAAICTAGICAPILGAPVKTSLTIGPGWAVVCETRSVAFTNIEQDLLLQDVPPEADLSSMSVTAHRFPVQLVTWRRSETAGATDAALAADALSFARSSDVVTWTPPNARKGDASGNHAVGNVVMCRLRAPSLGEHDVDVMYLMTGITWRAAYTVLLRGGLSNEEERVSVEISGALRVMNRTGHAFNGAQVRLVGEDVPTTSARDAPGFVLVDEDNPLADLWKDRDVDEPVLFDYAIHDPVRIAPQAETSVPLVSSARQPADRVYRMNGEDLPVAGRQQERPLRKYLVLKDDPAYGLGMALPPGEAEIFLGGTRSVLFQKASFAHTPANGEILIDLGLAENVVGSRRDMGREDSGAGGNDLSYDLLIENRLQSPVSVEVSEKPPTALAWDIIRAQPSYTVRGRRIQFSTRVEGKSTDRISYTIRVQEPTM